jgi:hypothetical protein
VSSSEVARGATAERVAALKAALAGRVRLGSRCARRLISDGMSLR